MVVGDFAKIAVTVNNFLRLKNPGYPTLPYFRRVKSSDAWMETEFRARRTPKKSERPALLRGVFTS